MSTHHTTNGHRPGASEADATIDSLYSFWPGTTPAPAPLPEAAFSVTVKGLMGGHDTMITVRAMTPTELQRNLAAIRGLLDPAPQAAPASPQGQDTTPQCPTHGAMRQGKRGWFCPVKVGDSYCTYTVKA